MSDFERLVCLNSPNYNGPESEWLILSSNALLAGESTRLMLDTVLTAVRFWLEYFVPRVEPLTQKAWNSA